MKGGSAERRINDWSISSTRWVGQDTSPIATGNLSDSLFALVEGKWVTLRVPYPMDSSKGMDGRIDDPPRGLERQGHLRHLFRKLERAYRRRQGHDAQSAALQVAPIAGEVRRSRVRAPLSRA